MKILVLIKQVPGTNNVQVDEKTGVLKREGVEGKMNPYDLTAMEAAVRIGEQAGATVTALTMGPPQAESILREAFMMGADECVLLSDGKFAGADVLATATALSYGAKALGGFDLILCGRQTTDGDTAQVGPELAELLGIPHAAWVSYLVGVDQKRIVAEQHLSDEILTVTIPFPCLITVEKNLYQPRLPSYRKMLETSNLPIRTLRLSDLAGCGEDMVGLKGSATQVERIFPPETNVNRMMLRGEAPELAEKLYLVLQDMKAIRRAQI